LAAAGDATMRAIFGGSFMRFWPPLESAFEWLPRRAAVSLKWLVSRPAIAPREETSAP